MRRPLALVAALALVPVTAAAGQPHALESRGGASVLSGPEAFRVGHVGANDSIGMVISPSGLPFDRWFTTATQLLARWPVDPATVGLAPGSSRLLVAASVGQNIYTPRNAELEAVSELAGDRPYSGWLAASFGADLVLGAAPLAVTGGGTPYTQLGLDLYAGAVGPWSGAGAVQHNAHHAWRVVAGREMPRIKGWGVAETAPGLAVDVSAHAETSLAALELPAPAWMSWSGGRLALHWRTGARADVGSTLLAGAATTTLLAGWVGDPLARRSASVPLVAYLYLRGEGRAVAWNATIDAPLVDGSVAAAHAPFVGEVSAGALVRVWRLELSWAHVYRTGEVASLPAPLRTGQLLWQWSVAYVP